MSYDDLPKMIKRLKRAAIDSYMHWNGFQIYEDHYTLKNSGNTFPHESDSYEHVTRPDGDGEHGGEWKLDGLSGAKPKYKDVNFNEEFNHIRARIDSALAPFINLPDPNGLVNPIEHCRRACRDLSCQASAEGGAASGGGDIADQIRLIHSNLTSMSGMAIAQFKSTFIGKMATAVGGMHAIAICAGSALVAEQKIFEGARAAVLETVQKGIEAFEKSTQWGLESFGIVLKIAEWALQGFGMFMTEGPVGVGTALADLGLTVATDLVSIWKDARKDATSIPDGSYDTIMSGFEQVLKDINDQIKICEETVLENITDNLERIRVDKTSYDLTIDPVESNEEVIIIQRNLAEEITKVYMPRVCSDLLSTGKLVLGLAMPVARSSKIGIGADGPKSKFYELTYLLYELIKDLSFEVDNGGANLQAAINDFAQADQENKAELDKAVDDSAGKLKGSHPYDPWN